MPFRDDSTARDAHLEVLKREADALERRRDESRLRADYHRARLEELRRAAIGEGRNQATNALKWGGVSATAFAAGGAIHALAEGPLGIVVGGIVVLGVIVSGWRIHSVRMASNRGRAERIHEALQRAAAAPPRARIAEPAPAEAAAQEVRAAAEDAVELPASARGVSRS